MSTLVLLESDDPDPTQLRALGTGLIKAVVEVRPGKAREALGEIRRRAVADIEVLVLRSILIPGVGARRLVETLCHLHRCRVEVMSLNEPWLSLGSGVGQFAVQLAGLMTHERNAHILSGVAHARSQGRAPGRPRAVVPPLVFAMADQGLSLRAIARASGLGASTVQRALAHRRALGSNHQIALHREGVE